MPDIAQAWDPRDIVCKTYYPSIKKPMPSPAIKSATLSVRGKQASHYTTDGRHVYFVIRQIILGSMSRTKSR